MSVIKKIFKEIFYFLSSKIFLKNFAGVLLLSAALIAFTSIWMESYTNHGETFQVQNYIGMQLDDAIREAKDRSFNIAINDSIFLVGKPGNMVLEQDPPAMSRVKENRTIYLTVTKKNADMKKLPNLAGGNDDFKQFSSKLKRLGIKSKIIERKFNNKLSESTILDVLYNGEVVTDKLDGKFMAPMGSTIEFIVSERGASDVAIPKLVCEQLSEARFIISNYNLSIGSIIPDETIVNEDRAYVWRQVPAYSSTGSVRIGEQINLHITQYKPEDCGGSKRPAPPKANSPVPTQEDVNIETGTDQPNLQKSDQAPGSPGANQPVPVPVPEEEEGFGDEFEEEGGGF